MSKPDLWQRIADDENKRAACVGHIDPTGKTLTRRPTRKPDPKQEESNAS